MTVVNRNLTSIKLKKLNKTILNDNHKLTDSEIEKLYN